MGLSKRRNVLRAAGAILVAGSVLTLNTKPAQALTGAEIAAAYALVTKIYGYFTTARNIWNALNPSESPNLVAKLDEVKAAIIGEIQYWVNVELDTATDAAFKKYRDILRNPDQTTSNRSRILFLTGSSDSNDASDIFVEMERVMTDGRNPQMSHRLALPFNTLSAIMSQAMSFHDKYFPEEAPFSWYSWNEHMGRTHRVNYRLVGANGVQCWPGHNPGIPYVSEVQNTFRSSILYRYLENKDFQVGTHGCTVVVDGATGPGGPMPIHYNPVTGKYKYGCGWQYTPSEFTITGHGTYPSFNASKAAAKARGEELAATAFKADTTVTNVKSVMTNMIKRSGGDDYLGPAGDLGAGDFFDPWVDEGSCGPQGPWAYVAVGWTVLIPFVQ